MKFVTLTVFAVLILCVAVGQNGFLVAAQDVTTTTTAAPIKCGSDEEYTTCIPCPQTCKELFRFCAQGPCVAGCKCKTGYFRNNEGKCVSIVACIIEIIKDQVSGIGS